MSKKRRKNAKRRKKYRIANMKLFLSAVVSGIVVIVLIIVAAVNVAGWLAGDKEEPEKSKEKETVAETTEATQPPEYVPQVKIEPSGDYVSINRLMIVNKHNPLDSDYVPDDLILPDSRTGTNESRQYMTREAADAMNALTDGAADAGSTIKVVSGYRDYNYQDSIFKRYASQDGVTKAETYSARAGYSEHQTGLCADVSSPSVGYKLSYSYDETKEGKWLAENCWKYGFIIRYPEGKTDITGYVYEPWHIRYVGQENAEKIKNSGLTLEEYTGNEAAPDYE